MSGIGEFRHFAGAVGVTAGLLGVGGTVASLSQRHHQPEPKGEVSTFQKDMTQVSTGVAVLGAGVAAMSFAQATPLRVAGGAVAAIGAGILGQLALD